MTQPLMYDVAKVKKKTKPVDQNSPEMKAGRIFDRVEKMMPEEKILEECYKDSRWTNCQVDIDKWTKEQKKAKEQLKMTTYTILGRQIEAAKGLQKVYRDQHKNKLCADALAGMIITGAVVEFMDEEDAIKFNEVRSKIAITLDVCDSFLNDLTAVIRGCGLNGDIVMMEDVAKARQSIGEWTSDTTRVDEQNIRDLFDDESDRTYNLINKHIGVFSNKVQKRLEKADKEKEAQDGKGEA